MREPKPRRTSVIIFFACGAWLVGLGLYFVFLRPALLPEDVRFIGGGADTIRALPPGLTRWLRHVFSVMGGFMIACGVLTMFLAAKVVSARRSGTTFVLVVAGLAGVALMSVTNFAIDSQFKWLLLAPAMLWLSGVVAYARERRT